MGPMREIPLTQGKVALVDDADYESLSMYKWHAWKNPKTGEFYARRNIVVNGKKTIIAMHTVLMQPPEGHEVDHVNLNGLDNRRENLRVVTRSQNMANTRSRGGSSAYKGVSWSNQAKKWHAYIGYQKRRIHIGFFNEERDAAAAYNTKAMELFGEHALLNDVR